MEKLKKRKEEENGEKLDHADVRAEVRSRCPARTPRVQSLFQWRQIARFFDNLSFISIT